MENEVGIRIKLYSVFLAVALAGAVCIYGAFQEKWMMKIGEALLTAGALLLIVSAGLFYLESQGVIEKDTWRLIFPRRAPWRKK